MIKIKKEMIELIIRDKNITGYSNTKYRLVRMPEKYQKKFGCPVFMVAHKEKIKELGE